MMNELLKYMNSMTEHMSSYFLPFSHQMVKSTPQKKQLADYIDVVSQYPDENIAVKPYPLIFIHGAFAGAWCWQEHFMPYFAQQGYVCHALNLRGHGNNFLKFNDLMRSIKLQDYVYDLENVIHEALELKSEEVILIGHSMGGMIVQKYLEKHNVKASILMASVPTRGVLTPYMQTALRTPLLFNQITMFQTFGSVLGPLVASIDTMKNALFSPNMPIEKVQHYFDTFGNVGSEPFHVILDMMGFDLPQIAKINRSSRGHMLVVGGKNDAFFAPHDVMNTAKDYHAYYKVFDNIAHAMMLEEDWKSVAEFMNSWVTAIINHDMDNQIH